MGVAGLLGLQTPVHATAPEVMNVLPGAQRAGSARLSVWGFDVYDATLYVAPGFRADAWAQSRLALELHYLRGFDGDDIAERSLEEMRRAGPIAAPQATQWLNEMKQAFPDVKKGDRLLGVYRPDEGVLFFHNGKPTTSVRDPAFAQRFFGIWLGPQTSEPAMRAALLATASAPAR